MSKLKLIVGLGNPGRTYQYTRHNLGSQVVAELARRKGLKFRKSLRLKSFIARGKLDGQAVELALPASYMNASGSVVKRLVNKNKLDLKDLLIVCDDINLEPGVMRIRPAGSEGGHNGLKSIIAALGTRGFPRLRVGIGKGKAGRDLAEFVLSNFDKREKAAVSAQIARAADCCLYWAREGIVKTMDKFNKG